MEMLDTEVAHILAEGDKKHVVVLTDSQEEEPKILESECAGLKDLKEKKLCKKFGKHLLSINDGGRKSFCAGRHLIRYLANIYIARGVKPRKKNKPKEKNKKGKEKEKEQHKSESETDTDDKGR